MANRSFSLPRTLLTGPLSQLAEEEVDVLVIGAGIAGLTVATSLSTSLSVSVVAKGELWGGSTRHAQGGIAASLAHDDSPQLHLADTLAAGAGLCDPEAVAVLVDEAAEAIAYLEGCGARLDRQEAAPALTREGGHSRRRVAHAGGDATGEELGRALLETARQRGVPLVADTFLLDLISDPAGTVAGAVISVRGSLRLVRARAVVLASGGAGQLFSQTTSPSTCTGDGMAAALRAGAAIADLEFVQFHPTALYSPQSGAAARPLISEALRGEGARLVDAQGASVTSGVHPAGDLAPRDVVSRAMVARMAEEGVDHLFLDATSIPTIDRRFPTVVAACRAAGIDPQRQWIPISPAAHYSMGGVRTDLYGRTNLGGLYAVGEVAACGVHGANRLASNSLLEGVVFGRRVAQALVAGHPRGALAPMVAPLPAREASRPWLRATMTDSAGVIRNGPGLEAALEKMLARLGDASASTAEDGWETANMYQLGAALVSAALRREESRGGHFRSDFPESSKAWLHRQLLRRSPEGELVIQDAPLGVSAGVSVGTSPELRRQAVG